MYCLSVIEFDQSVVTRMSHQDFCVWRQSADRRSIAQSQCQNSQGYVTRILTLVKYLADGHTSLKIDSEMFTPDWSQCCRFLFYNVRFKTQSKTCCWSVPVRTFCFLLCTCFLLKTFLSKTGQQFPFYSKFLFSSRRYK